MRLFSMACIYSFVFGKVLFFKKDLNFHGDIMKTSSYFVNCFSETESKERFQDLDV